MTPGLLLVLRVCFAMTMAAALVLTAVGIESIRLGGSWRWPGVFLVASQIGVLLVCVAALVLM